MNGEAETRRVPDEAIDHLRACDPVMAALVERVGALDHRVEPDLWRSLVGSIVGQQLSVAAARTIRARVAALGCEGFPTPAEILDVPEERLRQCGLSRAKLRYVRDLAARWRAGEIEAAAISTLGDEEVISRLTQVKGIGRWTAEMVLIFSLGRPDVLAVDDLGLRAAAERLYELTERPGRAAFLELGHPWAPYRSYASLYLWRSLESA